MRVVGIDPWEFVLALAREQVAAAGLGERIDLRQTAVEALEDLDRHDLAWVPTFFISYNVAEPAMERVHGALRPGGYAILGVYVRPDDLSGARWPTFARYARAAACARRVSSRRC